MNETPGKPQQDQSGKGLERNVELVAVRLAAVSAIAAAVSALVSAYQASQTRETIDAIFQSNLQSRQIGLCEEIIGDIEEFMAASHLFSFQIERISSINPDGTRTETLESSQLVFPLDEGEEEKMRAAEQVARDQWRESTVRLRKTIQVAKVYSSESTSRLLSDYADSLELMTPFGRFPRKMPISHFEQIQFRCRDIILGKDKGLL